MRSRAAGRVLIALITALGAAALAGTTHAVSAAVAIDGFRFLPQSVTVNVGETVTWTNRDPAQHTATATGVFDTGVLAMGQSRTLQLNTAGTFDYRCAIHGAMTGTVRVVAAATPSLVPPTISPPTAPPRTATPTATVVPPSPAPASVAPTASPSPLASAAAASQSTTPTSVAQASPSQRVEPGRSATNSPPVAPGGGPGPMLAVLAGLLAAGLVGAGIHLARRR